MQHANDLTDVEDAINIDIDIDIEIDQPPEKSSNREIAEFREQLHTLKEPFKSYIYLRHSGVNPGIAARFASLLNDSTVEKWEYDDSVKTGQMLSKLEKNPYLIEKRLYETEKDFTQAFLMTQLLCETALKVEDYALRTPDGRLRLLPKNKQKNGGDSMLESIRFDKEGNIQEVKRTRSNDLKLLAMMHIADTKTNRVADHQQSEISVEIEKFIQEGLKKSL